MGTSLEPCKIVLILLIVLVAIVVGAYHATTSEERKRFLEQSVQPAAVAIDQLIFATETFRAAARARTPWVVATPALAGLNVVVFVFMLLGDGALGDPATLLGWGANQGPLTTGGQWWRLFTAVFVQAGFFHLLFLLVGLAQTGELLERLLGPAPVVLVYVTAGIIGSLVGLIGDPLAVHVGGSAAVFGLYGLLLAVSVWGWLRPSPMTIPLVIFQTLAPAAALFFLYSLVTDFIGAANLSGFVVGVICGGVLTMNVGDSTPALRPVGFAAGAAVVTFVSLALPLRGIVDVRPDLVEIVASEDRSANVYRAAVGRFTTRQKPLDTRVLTELINGTILPSLQTARARVDTLDRALAEHRPLVASASEYLRLREASWRLRLEGLRKGSLPTLREAEKTEQASFEALNRLRGVRTTLTVWS